MFYVKTVFLVSFFSLNLRPFNFNSTFYRNCCVIWFDISRIFVNLSHLPLHLTSHLSSSTFHIYFLPCKSNVRTSYLSSDLTCARHEAMNLSLMENPLTRLRALQLPFLLYDEEKFGWRIM